MISEFICYGSTLRIVNKWQSPSSFRISSQSLFSYKRLGVNGARAILYWQIVIILFGQI